MENPKSSLDERWQLLIAQAMGSDLTEEEQVELGEVLCNKAFVKAASIVMLNAEHQKNQLMKLNFGDEVQRTTASQIQGKVTGMEAVFGLLLSYAKDKQ